MQQKSVFYSWQSNSEGKYNRYFIDECLQRAIKQLNRNDLLNVVIDRDTKSVPGMPDIGHSVCEKIARAAVMVADLTIINPKRIRRHQEEPVSNPNVLFELGYGFGRLGGDVMIGVVNLADGTVEELPFDLRPKRVLTYFLDARSERRNVREDLVRSLAEAIRLCLGDAAATLLHQNTEIQRRLSTLWVLGTEIGEWAGVRAVVNEIEVCRSAACEVRELMLQSGYPAFASSFGDSMARALNAAADMEFNDENWSDISRLVASAAEKSELIANQMNYTLSEADQRIVLKRLCVLATEIDDAFRERDRESDVFPIAFARLTRELRDISFRRMLSKHPKFFSTLQEISSELRTACIRWNKSPDLRGEATEWTDVAIRRLRELCAKYVPDNGTQ